MRLRHYGLRCLAFLSAAIFFALLFHPAAHAACSAYRSQVWLNEYFFGSGSGAPPNYLELYSTRSDFPGKWDGWKVEVYSSKNTKTSYDFTASSATVCTVANKTWVSKSILDGLRAQNALVLLKDSNGDYVDAFVFDNASPPAPWPSNNANDSWLPDLATSCPALAATLGTQAVMSGTKAKQSNMLVLGNYGNKDMARIPDGDDFPWDVTSNTGASTSYSQCASNNTNLSKTVDNATPAPGSTVTFTLNVTNPANNSASFLSGITVQDTLPADLTYISATASNTSDSVNTSSASSGTITWTPVAIAPKSSSKLYVKMQVPSNAAANTTYTNTATAATSASTQSDSVTITVQPASSVPSFAFSVSPASSTTCTSALNGPKVTITAMSQANGTGSVLTSYNGTATLSASSFTVKWYNSSGVALSGNTVTFTNGVATLYLTDTVAENVTVSAFDTTSYQPATMSGASSGITFLGSSNALVVTDTDTLNPSYGAVAGRPHKVQATMTSCGATSTSVSGSYAATIYYVPGMNHPSGAAAPMVSTNSSCSNPVALTQGTSGSSLTLTFSSGVATFYLCTTDVGQYALNVTANSRTGVSPNFTVRPFVITATGFTADSTTAVSSAGTSNSAGASAFTTAGSGFTGSFNAWRWLSSADADSNGLPDSGITANQIASGNPGLTASFSGTTNDAGVITIAPVLSGAATLGTLTPTIATLISGSVRKSLTYSEVGSILIGGGDSTSRYAATNYLGAAGLNVPILSDMIGRFTPHRFVVSATGVGLGLTPRADLSCLSTSGFTYMGEPFKLVFQLIAQNASGATTRNYQNNFAFLNPTASTSTSLIANSIGLGAVSGTTALTSRLGINELTSDAWSSGVNIYRATMTLGRGSSPDGPYTAKIGIAPKDLDGVTIATPNLDADNNGTSERVMIGTHSFRFGRLKLFNVFGSNASSLNMPVQAQYWTGNSWLVNTDDSCTQIASTAIGKSNYLDNKGAATAAWSVTAGTVSLTNGAGEIVLTKSPASGTGSVDICVDLGNNPPAGTTCTATSASMNYLQGRWPPGTSYDNDPAARASFGIYSPETKKTIHVREIY